MTRTAVTSATSFFSGRHLLLAFAALLPTACTVFEPPQRNPFVGAWVTSERQQVAFRDDTLLLTLPGQPPTPMSAATCDGQFRFAYSRGPRDTILSLTARQPDLQRKLTAMLVRPEYPVAEVTCGDGYSVYVLLDDRDVIVIHRDRDIGGLEQLTRA